MVMCGRLETPPPCNEFYLMNCTVRPTCPVPISIALMIDGWIRVGPFRKVYVMHCLIFLGTIAEGISLLQPSCRYSHDWFLSQEQLVTLAKNAKKAPCNFYKNGERFQFISSHRPRG